MKKKINPSDQELFRHAMRGVRPLVSPEVEILRKEKSVKKTEEVAQEETIHDSFSDHEYLDAVGGEEAIEFFRDSFSARELRRLRQGREPIQGVLDLHGKRVEEAKQALQHFLLDCQSQGKTQLLIIHGKGRGEVKPILKNKLNHWLRQADEVLAFCSAKPKDGGRGAVYLRIKKGSF